MSQKYEKETQRWPKASWTNIALVVGGAIFTLVWLFLSLISLPVFHFRVRLVLGPSPSPVAFGP